MRTGTPCPNPNETPVRNSNNSKCLPRCVVPKSHQARRPLVYAVPADGRSFLHKQRHQSDSCNVGIPSGYEPENIDRRYVIDENIGSASALCVFQTMENAPYSHEIRLEGVKLGVSRL
jgi:hypothetical protein